MRSLCRPFRLLLALFCVEGAAFAQYDEIDEPAGELPDEAGDVSDYGSVDYGASADDKVAGPDEAEAEAKSGEEESETWESYSEYSKGSRAEEITGGVRVEDIVEPPTDYRYAAFGKGDPFVPPLITEDTSAPSATADPLEIPIVSPLQRYKLSQLKIVGIWQLPSGERKAMVMTPDKGGIIVKSGDPIGDRGGKILGIGHDFMTVREFSLAPDGTRQFEDQQMLLGARRDAPVTGTITFLPGEAETKVTLDQPEGEENQVVPVEPAEQVKEGAAAVPVAPPLVEGAGALVNQAAAEAVPLTNVPVNAGPEGAPLQNGQAAEANENAGK